MSWRSIARDFPGVPPATLNAIYKHGREPKEPALRAALGLPELRLAEVRRPKTKRPRPSYKRLAEAYRFFLLVALRR